MELTTLPSQQMGVEHFTALYETILKNNDIKSANKLLDIYEKWKTHEYVVGFSGHFSAGKSTMINTFLEKDILPESPIPTSANVVKLTPGGGAARIFFHDQKPVEYQEPYDMDRIKDYCKDKQTIKGVEINTNLPILPQQTAVFDTPGIDAADDVDRLITEASMHLVDLLVYVMDYNHVQSEVNLQFLRTLNEKHIPFLVVINQIDKHDDTELSLSLFEDRVKQTFNDWNIMPEAIYFTSLMDKYTPHNQFDLFQRSVCSYLKEKKGWTDSIWYSVRQVIDEHKQELSLNVEEEMTRFSDEEITSTDIAQQIEETEEKLQAIDSQRKQLEREYRKELESTLKNAYLLPHDTREEAASFLESRQPDFKIGLFGSKKKTETEKESRQTALLQNLQETIKTTIQWRFRDKATKLLKQYGITNPELLEAIQQLNIHYTVENLTSLINPGAKVNGQSVLNYANDVSQDIKQRYKQEALALWQHIDDQLKRDNQKNFSVLEQELDQLKNRFDQLEQKDALQQSLQGKKEYLEEVFRNPESFSEKLSLDDLLQEKQSFTEPEETSDPIPATNEPKLKSTLEQAATASAHSLSVEQMCEHIDQTINIVEGLPGFQSIVHDLAEKRDRFIHQTYTIALFGAFSAGKSSFANALLGERVLPVSPNPTTAAINRVCPVTKDNRHGTVVVRMKDEGVLFHDLAAITKSFSPDANNLQNLLQWAEENKIYQNKTLKYQYQAYLQAMIKGYPESKDLLGDSLQVGLDEFQTYVSDETKACFVESIDVFYDCAMTRQGITLVDTPGADSINSRHTNVAFDYIKYADAMCFVTYYNHAFSRADQDFLLQLGRVKESFQLDKMFFIINAADLAKDETEMQLVTDYMEEQLMQFGIRFPKLFPVSSKQALQEKREKGTTNGRMLQFEQTFNTFIQNELPSLSIQAAEQDIQRAYQSMTNYIQAAKMNEHEKEQYQAKLSQEQIDLEQVVHEMDAALFMKQIDQKLEKQLYYVVERLGIRFHDMFKECFNPATVTETGKQATVQLEQNLNRLLDYAGYELVQELRAVSLRIEAYMHSLADDAYSALKEEMAAIDQKLLLPALSPFDFTTPEYKQAFTDLHTDNFQKSLAMFKGAKSFFVKNEKENMKEDIYQILTPFIERYMEDNKSVMRKTYQEQWQQMMKQMQKETIETIKQIINDTLSMLTETTDIKEFQMKQQELKELANTNIGK